MQKQNGVNNQYNNWKTIKIIQLHKMASVVKKKKKKTKKHCVRKRNFQKLSAHDTLRYLLKK